MKKFIVFPFIAGLLLSMAMPAAAADGSQKGVKMQPKKILVVYYSKTGNTERLANDIAAGLGADTEKLVDMRNRTGFVAYFKAGRDAMKARETELQQPVKNPADYDVVLIGTPVWGWSMTPAVRTYISKYKGSIKETGFFATAGGSGMDKTFKAMEELSGKKAIGSIGFVQKEFKNKEAYQQKLDGFIKLLK